METGNTYLSHLLTNYKTELKKQKREIKTLPEGVLSYRKQHGHTNFIRLIPAAETADGKIFREGITKNDILLRKMARKAYLDLSISLLSEEISRLDAFLKKRTEPSPENILARLPEWMDALPEEIFFPQKQNADKWAAADYWRNGKNPEELRHITTKGLRVRSKSELIIAEKLDSYGIPYRYDQVIRSRYNLFSPDFTFNTANGLFYWEHCGKMADPDYRDYNKWKLSEYESIGIVPWKNLIITYDSTDGDLDVRIIDAEIRNRLL